MARQFGAHVTFPQIIDEASVTITLHCIGIVMDIDAQDKDYAFVMPTHWARQTKDVKWSAFDDVHFYRCKIADMTAVDMPDAIEEPAQEIRSLANAIKKLAPDLALQLIHRLENPDGAFGEFLGALRSGE